MNWDAIGAIGELVGAAAVVGTLFYLAIQIRLSNIDEPESNMSRGKGKKCSLDAGSVLPQTETRMG